MIYKQAPWSISAAMRVFFSVKLHGYAFILLQKNTIAGIFLRILCDVSQQFFLRTSFSGLLPTIVEYCV